MSFQKREGGEVKAITNNIRNYVDYSPRFLPNRHLTHDKNSLWVISVTIKQRSFNKKETNRATDE